MRQKRILAVLAGGATVTVTAATLMVATGTSSFAATDAAPVPPVTVSRDIERIPAANLRVVSPGGAGVSKAEADRARTYVETQVRAGRGVDVSGLRVASGRTRSGAEVGAVLEPGDNIQELIVSSGKVASNSPSLQGVGAITASSGAAESASAPAGAGFDAASNRSGFSRWGRDCRTLFFEPSYSHKTDHYIYDCWEKWHSTEDYRDWIYNRYTLFDAGDGKWGWKGQTVDATIRFRPWKGYESRISGGPYDYVPKPSSVCKTSSVTLGGQKGGASASIEIPYVQCSPKLSVFPRSDTHSMGTDWDGRTTAQVYLDSAANFVARSKAVPYFADYDWMEIKYCWGPGPCTSSVYSDRELWKDKYGW